MSESIFPSEGGAVAIACAGLGKSYKLGEELSLQHSVKTLLRLSPETDDFWALKDVSFTVRRGDYFGIVGSNGSGKSTLTQILSGIAVPSAGSARVYGRVLPLLEVAAGFHLELTGRENVVLLGTILGLKRAEIDAEMERIGAFSGVERHLDTPVKRYSSGMMARLSFAIAICFPADIYVFDEVLAVVDDSFREQCMQRLADIHESGASIIFMSHDLDLVASVCDNGMWLEQGSVRVVGPMDVVAETYAAYSRDFSAGRSG